MIDAKRLTDGLKLRDKSKITSSPSPEEPQYGGRGPFELPADHRAGMEVPEGGSMCANCKFGDPRDDGPHCLEPNFVRWNGGDDLIPAPDGDPTRYCSDWYQPKG